jgi:hypothetical protein
LHATGGGGVDVTPHVHVSTHWPPSSTYDGVAAPPEGQISAIAGMGKSPQGSAGGEIPPDDTPLEENPPGDTPLEESPLDEPPTTPELELEEPPLEEPATPGDPEEAPDPDPDEPPLLPVPSPGGSGKTSPPHATIPRLTAASATTSATPPLRPLARCMSRSPASASDGTFLEHFMYQGWS